jgi:hypothetical protein
MMERRWFRKKGSLYLAVQTSSTSLEENDRLSYNLKKLYIVNTLSHKQLLAGDDGTCATLKDMHTSKYTSIFFFWLHQTEESSKTHVQKQVEHACFQKKKSGACMVHCTAPTRKQMVNIGNKETSGVKRSVDYKDCQ